MAAVHVQAEREMQYVASGTHRKQHQVILDKCRTVVLRAVANSTGCGKRNMLSEHVMTAHHFFNSVVPRQQRRQ
jgi:hemerythrin